MKFENPPYKEAEWYSIDGWFQKVKKFFDVELRSNLNIVHMGARWQNTTAQNRVILQKAIAEVDAAGGGIVIVPNGIDYGYRVDDVSTHPDMSAVVNDVTVIDYGPGLADATHKAGSNVRYFFGTENSSPLHNGNSFILHSTWHPSMQLYMDAVYAAPGDPSRTASDNRRASIIFGWEGLPKWRLGQGNLGGTTLTNDEMGNFVLEAWDVDGLVDYAPFIIERMTGNWSFGFNTSIPPAAFHFTPNLGKGSAGVPPTGAITIMAVAHTTVCTVCLRVSAAADPYGLETDSDVNLRNSAGNFIVHISSQGNALNILKATRRVGIGVDTPLYKLHVIDSRTGDFAAKVENTHATNGSGLDITSASAAGTGWYGLRMYSDGGSDLKHSFRGDGEATCDGAFTGGGAERAECLEWADGNPEGSNGNKLEIAHNRLGCSVVLEDGKIRLANKNEEPLGVVSVTYDSLGNAFPLNWRGKYLKTDFGQFVMEDCEVVEWEEKKITPGQKRKNPDGSINSSLAHDLPDEVQVFKRSYFADRFNGVVPSHAVRTKTKRRKVSPTFDEKVVYLPRMERKEWDAIGILGLCRLRKGQPVAKSWQKMRDVSDTVEEWFVR